MAISKVVICNMALGHLGSDATVEDIDTPRKDEEKIFNLWYDASRKDLLRLVKPNFALKRAKWALLTTTPVFGYVYEYQIAHDCLMFQGVDTLDVKLNNYTIEGDKLQISEVYTDGLPVRYVSDVTDVTKFTADFVKLLSWQLAFDTCMQITQSVEKLQMLSSILPGQLSKVAAQSDQENRPIRINYSKFRTARWSKTPIFGEKL